MTDRNDENDERSIPSSPSPGPPSPTSSRDDDDDDGKKGEEGGEGSPSSSSPAEGDDGAGADGIVHCEDDDDEKSHTFRKRRLTYARHRLEGAAAELGTLLAPSSSSPSSEEGDDGGGDDDGRESGGGGDDEEKGGGDDPPSSEPPTIPAPSPPAPPSTRKKKRRKDADDDDARGSSSPAPPPDKKKSKKKKATKTKAKTSKPPKRLRTRVVHAGEILRKSSSALAESTLSEHPLAKSKHRLYHPPHSIEQEDDWTTSGDSRGGQGRGHQRRPSWKRRRHVRGSFDDGESDESKLLPFPRDVVGTYSCHGVEPLYDSDYEYDEDDDEEDEDDKDERKEQDPTTTTVAKINQDRGGVAFPYGNCPRTALFAAYDGHGQGGELVSQYALHEIQRKLELHPNFQDDVSKAFKDTFLEVDEALTDEPDIEPLYCGTTACVVLLRDDVLSVSNAGDSRAVVARRRRKKKKKSTKKPNGRKKKRKRPQDGSGEEGSSNDSDSDTSYEPIDLTIDQNPDTPDEMERILSLGGHVSPPPEPGLSARVWLDPDHTQIGLAMARSIGDHAVRDVGVIAEPVVTTRKVDKENDEFLILATDGVWEFLSSGEAVDIVAEKLRGSRRKKKKKTTKKRPRTEKNDEGTDGHDDEKEEEESDDDETDHRQDGSASDACRALIEAAASRWHDEEGDYRDDITALVVRLKKLW